MYKLITLMLIGLTLSLQTLADDRNGNEGNEVSSEHNASEISYNLYLGDLLDAMTEVMHEAITDSQPSESSRFALNIWGISYHPKSGGKKLYECNRKKPNGEELNECNWGLGLRYYHDKCWFGDKCFSEVNSMKNSVYDNLTTINFGITNNILSLGDFKLSYAVALVFARYGHKTKDTKYGLGPIPALSLAYKDGISLTLVVVPSFDLEKRGAAVYTFFVSFPFDTIRKIAH